MKHGHFYVLFLTLLCFLGSADAQVCVLYREDFNEELTDMQFVPAPYGEPNLCIYPDYAVDVPEDGEHHVILGCGDEAEFRKTLNLPYGRYKITLKYRTGADYYGTSDCTWTNYDTQYGANCQMPKRMVVIDKQIAWKNDGAKNNFSETASFIYEGKIGNAFISFGSAGYPYPWDTWYDYFEIASPIPVGANFSVQHACKGSETEFKDESSAGIETWNWDFGDGATSTVQHPKHTYADTGTYEVKLSIKDLCGKTASRTKTVRIVDSVKFAVQAPDTACVGDTVHMRANTNHPMRNYVWDFGDGNSKSGPDSVWHVWYNTGNYVLGVTGVDSTYCVGLMSTPIHVMGSTLASFTATDKKSGVEFQNLSFNGAQQIWEFGDGQTSTQKDPVHSYSAAGTYKVCLISMNSCSTDTLCQDVEVKLGVGLGASNAVMDQMEIWPNPGSGWYSVELPGRFKWGGSVKIKVLDISGKLVYSAESEYTDQRLMVQLDHLRSGTYSIVAWQGLKKVQGMLVHVSEE